MGPSRARAASFGSLNKPILNHNNSKLHSNSLSEISALQLPYAVFLEQIAPYSILTCTGSTQPSLLSDHQSSTSLPIHTNSPSHTSTYPTTTSSSTIIPTSDIETEKDRYHIIKKYNREVEKWLKEFKFALVPPMKQIKGMNCSMQTALLPAELHSLSNVMAILNLLQSEKYSSHYNMKSSTHNNTTTNNNTTNNNSSSNASTMLSEQAIILSTQSNWREYLSGYVLYKQVIPHCMSRSSKCIQLPLVHKNSHMSIKFKVEGAIGYTIQYTLPPHIPSTHILKVTGYIYSYNPTLVKSNLTARRRYLAEKLQNQNTMKDLSNSKTNTTSPDNKNNNSNTNSTNTNNNTSQDIKEEEVKYLRKEVLHEICGWENDSYIPTSSSSHTATVTSVDDTINQLNQQKYDKQDVKICYDILQNASTQFVAYNPHTTRLGTHMTMNSTTATNTSTEKSNTFTNGKINFYIGDTVIRNPRKLGVAGTVAQKSKMESTIDASYNNSNNSTSSSVPGELGDIYDIRGPLTLVNIATINGEVNNKVYQVYVHWRDTNMNQSYMIPENISSTNNSTTSTETKKNNSTTTTPVLPKFTSLEEEMEYYRKLYGSADNVYNSQNSVPLDPFYEDPALQHDIILWRHNHLNYEEGYQVNTTTSRNILWTPPLCKELEFTLVPYQSTADRNNNNNNATDNDHDDNDDHLLSSSSSSLHGFVSFMVTPILAASSVIYSSHHADTVQDVVDVFNLLPSPLATTGQQQQSHVTSSTYSKTQTNNYDNKYLTELRNKKLQMNRRDKIDLALVGLIEKVLKQR